MAAVRQAPVLRVPGEGCRSPPPLDYEIKPTAEPIRSTTGRPKSPLTARHPQLTSLWYPVSPFYKFRGQHYRVAHGRDHIVQWHRIAGRTIGMRPKLRLELPGFRRMRAKARDSCVSKCAASLNRSARRACILRRIWSLVELPSLSPEFRTGLHPFRQVSNHGSHLFRGQRQLIRD